MKIALTGGIACGKSLVARFLNEAGVQTLDADDIVHELIPADERKKLAKRVFADATARKALESRIHPLVKARIASWQSSEARDGALRIAVVPLLFEAHWAMDFDIILCVTSERATQIARMTATRGYSIAEAEARLAAQWPVAAKAAQSHYVIANDGSPDALRGKVTDMVEWLKEKTKKRS